MKTKNLFGSLLLAAMLPVFVISCGYEDTASTDPHNGVSARDKGQTETSTVTQIQVGELQNGVLTVTANESEIIDIVTEYHENVEGEPVGSHVFTDVFIEEFPIPNQTTQYALLIEGILFGTTNSIEVGLTLERQGDLLFLTAAATQDKCTGDNCSDCDVKYDDGGGYCSCSEVPRPEDGKCNNSAYGTRDGSPLILVTQLIAGLD